MNKEPAMGCRFGDLNNDGWLDFYVGTGAPDLAMLVPNRMFRNVEGVGAPGRDHLRRHSPTRRDTALPSALPQ